MEKARSKIKRYLDADVLTAAKERLNHLFDTFDHLCVSFSGGKDSLALLHLTREVQLERGDSRPTPCLFRDEELIPDEVIRFVDQYKRDTANWDMRYYAVPLQSNKFILGKTFSYIQWDPARCHIRPKPEYAITLLSGFSETHAFSQYDMDEAAFAAVPGHVAILTGIRADESVNRLAAVVSKPHEPYISNSGTRVTTCRPIYDWSQNDIFRYIYDRKIMYCPIYDNQTWNRQGLRVSTPLHQGSAKRISQLRTLYPVFYEQLIDLFPEMLAQERYWDSLDRHGIIDEYEPSVGGILKYIEDHITDPEQNLLAKKRLKGAAGRRRDDENYGGYPLLYIFMAIVNGDYKRNILPLKTPRAKMIEYEQKAKAAQLRRREADKEARKFV